MGDINRGFYNCNCSCKDLNPATHKGLNVEVEDKVFSFFPPSQQELQQIKYKVHMLLVIKTVHNVYA